MSVSQMLSIGGLLIGIIALILISVFCNWQTALGVFLFTWANNIDLAMKFKKSREI